MNEPDPELLARIARCDGAALGAFYDRHGGLALAVAARVLGDRAEAEDVVQEVFVRVWSEAARFDPARGTALSWLLSSTRNAAIDRLRRRGARERAVERAAGERDLVTPPPGVSTEDVDERVRAAVRALPEDQRRTIELAYFDGLTQTQLAARLEQPLGTIKSRIRLGMQKLRAALTGVDA